LDKVNILSAFINQEFIAPIIPIITINAIIIKIIIHPVFRVWRKHPSLFSGALFKLVFLFNRECTIRTTFCFVRYVIVTFGTIYYSHFKIIL